MTQRIKMSHPFVDLNQSEIGKIFPRCNTALCTVFVHTLLHKLWIIMYFRSQIKPFFWLGEINKWMTHFHMLSHYYMTHWWIRSDDSLSKSLFRKKNSKFTNESYKNDSTYKNDSFICRVRPIRDLNKL